VGIVVLDGELASRIAAGEVVERPASVEKELIENALDAGARRISVSIEAGGIGLIEVADDGGGMNAADARLCLERHATSKLKEFSDLEEIASYGFRGEALPSIASVSRLSIRTRQGESEEGLELSVDGKLSPEVKVVASPKGTVVSVRDLFFNVPARRKFLRSSNTESGHASEVFVDAALSRPDVAFSLTRDGRVVKKFPRVATTRERVEQVLGETELICAEAERGPLHVAAYLCTPERARRGASGLKILVNGRPIRDRSLSSTIAHAFGSSLERGRFPRGVVYLTLPGRLVDVNVHPQKTEVRFASARAVLDALHSVISRATAEVPGGAAVPTQRPPSAAPPRAHVLRDGPRPISGERYGTRGRGPRAPSVAARSTLSSPSSTLSSPSSTPPVRSSWRGLRFVGQAGPGYLLCESKDGISVLDQHAADEVRLRGRLESALRTGPLPGQSLLFPSVLELSPSLAKALPKREEALHRLGLDVRERSAHSVSVHSIPRLLSKLDPEVIFSIIEEHLLSSKLSDKAALAATLSEFACRAALTAESSISRVDAEQLLRDLRDSDLELLCRHARPLVFSVSYAELSRKKGLR
jgi:DNA mismatch repair protein MutL